MGEKTSGLFRIIVSFEDKNGAPLSGRDWVVRVFDEDPISDELLAESRLDGEGKAKTMFSVADVKSLDSPGERQPDIYFELLNDGTHFWQSEVFRDVDFEALDPVTGRAKGLTKTFGPFRVGDLRSKD